MDRVTTVAKVISVVYVALAPSLLLQVRTSRNLIPRHVSQAGRDDAIFRRMKLLRAQGAVMERQDDLCAHQG